MPTLFIRCNMLKYSPSVPLAQSELSVHTLCTGTMDREDLPQQFLELALEHKEKESAVQYIYFVNISRVLDQVAIEFVPFKDLATLTRADNADAIRDAFDNPLPSRLGWRPRSRNEETRVELVVVFQEKHADGTSSSNLSCSFSPVAVLVLCTRRDIRLNRPPRPRSRLTSLSYLSMSSSTSSSS